MSRKQRELDREMRNCKRKETQLKIAQDSLESTQHLFNSAKEVVDLPNPNVLLNQVNQDLSLLDPRFPETDSLCNGL